MSYRTRDTDWAVSAKGNTWRRQEGKVLVVGARKNGRGYWAMRDGEFLSGDFANESQAMRAAEADANKDQAGWTDFDDEWRQS
jgi:hypothetical protein